MIVSSHQGCYVAGACIVFAGLCRELSGVRRRLLVEGSVLGTSEHSLESARAQHEFLQSIALRD